MAVERLAGRGRGRLRAGQRHGEDGVRAEGGLVVGAVEVEHRLVDRRLVGGVSALERGQDFLVNVGDGLPDAFAEVAVFVAVAQLERLVFAGARAAGDGGTANGAALEGHVCLDSGVAARVEDFAGQDAFNVCHEDKPPDCGWRDMIGCNRSPSSGGFWGNALGQACRATAWERGRAGAPRRLRPTWPWR